MKPYYQDEWVTIYNADCREILPELPKVDLVLTDPPYGINYDGSQFTKWNGQKQAWGKIINDSPDYDLSFLFSYPRLIVWGAEYLTQYINGGSWIIWDKRVNESNDRMIGNPIEMAWNSKGRLHKIYRIQHGGVVNADSILGNNAVRYHPTQKPVTLFKRILNDNNSLAVIDPFLGSGTTCLAAKELGRKSIGIEISEKYCEIAAKRCMQTVMNFEPVKEKPKQGVLMS